MIDAIVQLAAATGNALQGASPILPAMIPVGEATDALTEAFPSDTGPLSTDLPTVGQVLNSYLFVFVIAFVVTILVVPLIRRLALHTGVVDWPDDSRKTHRQPVAYLGGVAVFLGLMAGIASSYLTDGYQFGLATIPPSVILALAVIMLTGLADDVYHWDPYLKIGGQLFAAAALALDPAIGENVANGLLKPFEAPIGQLLQIDNFNFIFDIMPGAGVMNFDLPYWVGAFIIAAFVIGGCNAANLIDGLDGLLTGSTAIMSAALLAISVILAVKGYGDLTGARIVLCFALLGASLGFLPHNFRPATIFLGDSGSLLVGFSIMVIILMLGEKGMTHLVFAGLIVFGLPIMDTVLAILRRKLTGQSISEPDSNHLHHMLMRTRLGTVGAVFVMYGITALFASLAVIMVVMRARVVYAIILVLTGFIVVVGIKVARRAKRQEELNKIKTKHSPNQ